MKLRQFLVLVMAGFVGMPLAAQTVTGTMRGTVTDRSGGSLPGVTVTIRNVETGLERVVITDKAGSYNAPFLQIGRYNVQAELSGFGTMHHNNVRVDLNTTVVQDFILDPAMHETVTVAVDAPRIDVTDGEVKQTMRAKEIEIASGARSDELPPPGVGVYRLPGKSDQRTGQPGSLIRIVRQFQRHRNPRRDVPDQRREQRRCLGKPEPAERARGDDSVVSDPDQQLQRGVRARLRLGRPRADQAGNEHASTARSTATPRTTNTSRATPRRSASIMATTIAASSARRPDSRSFATGCSRSSIPIRCRTRATSSPRAAFFSPATSIPPSV